MRWIFAAFALVGCGFQGEETDDSAASVSESAPPSTTDAMSVDEFAAAYADKYCSQLEECGADFACSTTGTTTYTVDLSDCTYDAVAAEACIDSEWTCDEENFPIPPEQCNNVLACPSTTRGTSTGTY